MATGNINSQNFQSKLNHSISAANSFCFQVWLKEKQNYAPSVQKLKGVVLGMHPQGKKYWFLLVNILEKCGLNMQYINAPNIILGISNPLDPDNSNNQVILILKYFFYKWWSKIPDILFKIEKTTINFLYSTQKEYM